MKNKPLVSLLINNYNYGAYISTCIESALNQSYDNCEIIIVDDGSSDNSVEIIKAYCDRIKFIAKSNGGQGSAYNAGFAASHGEIVLFLDSDDFLLSDAVTRVVDVWKNGVAKAQFRLSLVDDRGYDLPGAIPASMHDGDVTEIIGKFGCYASSPGTGNAYSAEFLRQILPIDENNWRIAADSYVINLIPFFGSVVSIKDVLGKYRIGKKKGDLASKFVFNNSPATPWDSLKRTLNSLDLLGRELVARGYSSTSVFQPTPALMKIRLISKKFFPQFHPIAGDTITCCALEGVRCVWSWTAYSIRLRIVYAIWFTMVACLPRFLAQWPALILVNADERRRFISLFRLRNAVNKKKTTRHSHE